MISVHVLVEVGVIIYLDTQICGPCVTCLGVCICVFLCISVGVFVNYLLSIYV